VLTRKWPDQPHWEYDALRLGADAHGQWVGLPVGTWMARPGAGMHATAPHVVLLPHDGWWLATFYGDEPERPFDVYVDIATPWRWNADETEARAVDLDLDVIKGSTGRVWVDDEDEFAQHRVSLGYPVEIVAAAMRSCDEVHAAVAHSTGAFGGAHRDWLARLRRL
jgi:predicted RNA-binding protein associated with RNAse of E/G family